MFFCIRSLVRSISHATRTETIPLQPIEVKNANPRSAEEKQNENPQAIRETINKARYRALFVFFTVLLPPGVEEYRNDYSFSHGRRALLKIVVLARKIISQQKKR